LGKGEKNQQASHKCISVGSIGISTMPPAMKRPAARMSPSGAAQEPVLKKQAAVSVQSRHVSKLCNQVAKAILSSPEYPEEVKSMLANAIDGTLVVPKEKRHVFQTNVIEMISEILDGLKAAAQSKLDDAEKKLEMRCKESEQFQSAVEAAATMLAERKKMATAADFKHAELASARVTAKQLLASAERKQASGNAGLLDTEQKKQKLESVLETVFGPLKGGEMPATKVQDGITRIQKLAEDLGFDASLLLTVPAAFAKAPSERGSFNNVVIEQMEAEFQNRMVTFTDELANGEPAKKERADEVEAASSEHAQALASEEAAKSTKEAARTAQKESETEHDARVKEQQQGMRDMDSASKRLDAAKAELAVLHDGPLSAFRGLLEFTEVPPPPAPVPASEDPTAADAPERAAHATEA